MGWQRRQLVRTGLGLGCGGFLGWPREGLALERIRISHVTTMLDLVGEDGRRMRLAHVEFVRRLEDDGRWVPFDPTLRQWLERQLKGLMVDVTGDFDRSGRLLVDPHGEDGASVVGKLLASGRAVFRPDLGKGANAELLLAEEERARQSGLGIWARPELAGPLDHEKSGELVGHYGLVTGRILQSATTRYYVYANFGERWRTDFTLRVPKDEVKPLARAGLDLMLLEGQTVRARGWVFEENGPMIEIINRHAVEVMS